MVTAFILSSIINAVFKRLFIKTYEKYFKNSMVKIFISLAIAYELFHQSGWPIWPFQNAKDSELISRDQNCYLSYNLNNWNRFKAFKWLTRNQVREYKFMIANQRMPFQMCCIDMFNFLLVLNKTNWPLFLLALFIEIVWNIIYDLASRLFKCQSQRSSHWAISHWANSHFPYQYASKVWFLFRYSVNIGWRLSKTTNL